MIKLKEEEFKKQFTTNFVSTWVANNYDDACMRGQHNRLREPPFEDAFHLADEAWEHYMELFDESEIK